MVLQALPGAAGRVALRLLPEGRLAGPPPRRRLIRALLQDAADTAGGAVFETTAGEMLLLGAMAGAARRVVAVLAGLDGDAAATTLGSAAGRRGAARLGQRGADRRGGRAGALAPAPAGRRGWKALDAVPAEGVLRADPLVAARDLGRAARACGCGCTAAG